MLAVPGGEAAFVPTTARVPRSSSDPGHHPIPQPAVSICLMDLPSYFPMSEIYLQHTHLPSRRHHQKFIFWLGKLLSVGLAETFAPFSQSFCEGAVAPISSSLQMIMWPLVLSGIIGNVVNVIANCIFLYVLHLGIA